VASHAWWKRRNGFQLVRAVIGDKRAEDAAGSDRTELVRVPKPTASLASACFDRGEEPSRGRSVRAIPVSSRITTLWRSKDHRDLARARARRRNFASVSDRTPASPSTCAAIAEGREPRSGHSRCPAQARRAASSERDFPVPAEPQKRRARHR